MERIGSTQQPVNTHWFKVFFCMWVAGEMAQLRNLNYSI